jgi:hypothetical protein
MDYKYTAIIIEPRKYKALSFVIDNMLDCLSNDWKIILFCGINNEDYSNQIVQNLNSIYGNRIILVKLDIINLDQHSYSELLANRMDIYNYIDTEYFLIFQTDSMMFKRNSSAMDNFLSNNYDYVGAPWLKTDYSPTKERDYIGNGGFSLRKKSKMVEIIQNNTWDPNNEWQEDLFFTKKYHGIITKKPQYEFAQLFCVDEVFTSITMACHKPWVHSFYQEFVDIYPECEDLKNLQYEES